MVNRTGRCLCTAVQFQAEGDPRVVGHCHCRDCQKSSGGGHVTFAFYPKAAVTIAGRTASYRVPGEAGGSMTRYFCPHCGSRMFAESSRQPDLFGVVLGAFDDPGAFVPTVSLFVAHRQPWDGLAEGTVRFQADIGAG